MQNSHPRHLTRITTLWLFASLGGIAQVGQVVLLRELLTLAYGTELTIALVLGTWLILTAFGSAMAAGFLSIKGNKIDPLLAYSVTSVKLVVFTPVVLWALRNVRGWLNVPIGEPITATQLLLITFAALLPFCSATGSQFVYAVAFARSAGGVYAVECIGAAVVGWLLSFVLLRWLEHFPLMALFLTLHLLMTAVLLFRFRPSAKLAATFMAMATSVVLIGSPLLEHQTQQRFWHSLLPSMQLLKVRTSPYGNIAVVGYKGQISVYQHGRLLFTLPEQGEWTPLAHLVMLQHPKPRQVLLIGGMGGWLKAVLGHPVVRVDWVELDPTVMDATRAFLPPVEQNIFSDRRVQHYADDGRAFVRRTNNRYDIIIVVASDPTTAAANRYFTREFFEQLRRVLDEDGILALCGLSEPPAGFGELYLERNRIVFETMCSVFPKVLPVPSNPIILLATERLSLALNEASLLHRVAERNLGEVNLFAYTDPIQVRRIAYELRTGKPFNPLATEQTPSSPIAHNTDTNPVVYFLSSLLWVRMSDEGLASWLEEVKGFSPVWFWLLAVVPLLWLLPLRRQSNLMRRQRLFLAITVIGMFGMAAEVVVLLAFQSRFGTLYQQVGSLFALFMVGLAVGSWKAQRCKALMTVKALALLSLTAGVLSLTWLVLSKYIAAFPDLLAWLAYGTAIVLLGGLVGAAFPLTVQALMQTGMNSERAAGSAYAFDLLGGALGAFFFGAFLVPLQGTATVFGLLTVLCAVTGLTLWFGSAKNGMEQ